MSVRKLAATLVALVALTAGCAGGDQRLSAAEQVPALVAGLQRVDAALAAHEFALARSRLRELRSLVLEARSTDELGAADASRVLDAIAQLRKRIPASMATPSSTPVPAPSVASPSESSRPSHHRSTTAPTTTPTPGVTQAATPSTSASPTTAPSPTASGTGDASAMAVPTSTPTP